MGEGRKRNIDINVGKAPPLRPDCGISGTNVRCSLTKTFGSIWRNRVEPLEKLGGAEVRVAPRLFLRGSFSLALPIRSTNRHAGHLMVTAMHSRSLELLDAYKRELDALPECKEAIGERETFDVRLLVQQRRTDYCVFLCRSSIR